MASSKSLRELRHKIPAGILLPLAELILGIGDFAFCGRRPRFPVGTGQFPKETVWFAKQTVRRPGPASLERLDLTFSSLPTSQTAKLRPDALRVGQTTGSVCAICSHESGLNNAQSARRVHKGCYYHNRGGRNAADHREQGSTGTVPRIWQRKHSAD